MIEYKLTCFNYKKFIQINALIDLFYILFYLLIKLYGIFNERKGSIKLEDYIPYMY